MPRRVSDAVAPPSFYAVVHESIHGRTIIAHCHHPLDGAEEVSLAREVQAGADNPDRVHLVTGLSFRELVALVDSVDLLVSNDTGPMRIGPALGVPTVGIFVGGSPHLYRPTGPLEQYVKGNSTEEIGVETVIGAMDKIWKRINLA